MLAKIFVIILGVFGVVTTTINSPASNIPAVSKTATTTFTVKNKTDNKTDDFTLLKSTTTPSKVGAKKTPPIVNVVTKKVEPAKPEIVTSLSTATPTIVPSKSIDFASINQLARASLVNIICASRFGGSFEPLSGSGVIIDPRGIILTNSHIAQYLLLENYRVDSFLKCIARNGSPAVPKYTLKLLYISERWANDNYKQITSSAATSTGENDFALLQIVGRTDPDLKLDESFPSIAIEEKQDKFQAGNSALIAGYPAGFLSGISIQRELYAASSIITIGQRYTFSGVTVDAFSLGGSPVAQRGSSGGAVVNSEGKLIGIIVTSTNAPTTAGRDLDAISISHISRGLQSEIGLSLNSLLASNLEISLKEFNDKTLPAIRKLFVDEIDAINKN